MKKTRAALLILAPLLIVAAVFLLSPGYYAGSTFSGRYCVWCHEIQPSYDQWAGSSHREVQCSQCHGSALTLDAGFHSSNLRRVFAHLQGEVPERILFRGSQVDYAVEGCERCHRSNYALWKTGGHSMTYADVYLNGGQNRKTLLVEDCVRCHGMFFQGAIADLVAPLDTVGPWSLLDPSVGPEPAIPCLACHQMHSEGTPLKSPNYAEPLTISYSKEVEVFSLGFYDQREKGHFLSAVLPLPPMAEKGRPVKMSPDSRQRVCYQCHAPEATLEVGTGDDRTAIGVHEGIGCLGCHDAHSLDARSSCADCHPKTSNCKLDVEQMNTSFKSPESPHNIHFVKCADCHPQGVPGKPR